MDLAWRTDVYSPSTACEVASYEILDSDRLDVEAKEISRLTKEIAKQPYDPELWLSRGQTLRLLGFPELALGDVYKARLLVEAALENATSLGENTLLAFGVKLFSHHSANPAWVEWRSTVATPDMLESMVTDVLKQLELQIWTELMEGLMASNACSDYLKVSQEAVAKFPSDQVFPSEVQNAQSWFKQRQDILAEQKASGELSEEKMQATLYNGGVYPTEYPWMTADLASRDDQFLQTIKEEFKLRSTNVTVARSAIRDVSSGDESSSPGDVLGVVAMKDISIADIVLVDGTVAAAISSADRCATCCGALVATFTNSCCGVLYCSKVCSTLAIQTFHSAICGKDFKFLSDAAEAAQLTTELSLDSLLILRVLALSIHENASHPLKTSILERLTPTYEIDNLIIFNLSDHIMTPIRILTELGIDVFANANYDTWVLHTMRCRLQNNKHGQTLDELPGTAVNPLYSMFNHSWAPNVDWRHDGNDSTLTLFAVKPIVEGEECFISYIKPLTMGWSDRQEALASWLGMECGCVRCLEERPVNEE